MIYTVKKVPGPLPWKVGLVMPLFGNFLPVEHCFTWEIAVITALYRRRCDA